MKKFLILSLLSVVSVFFTDYLIHGVWMKPAYEASAEVWRSPEAMQAQMPVMIVAQVLMGISFAALCSFSGLKGLRGIGLLVFCLSLLSIAQSLTFHAVLPIEASLTLRWCVFGVLQMLFLGSVAFFVEKGKGPG